MCMYLEVPVYDGGVLGVHVGHCRTSFKEHPQHLPWGELERPHHVLHSATWGGGGRGEKEKSGEGRKGRGA